MQKIQIQNFKAVKSAEIEIKKTVLLIGEQASGKSTIAKLVYFFKSLRDDYISFISENLGRLQSPANLQEDFWAEIGHKFYRFFGSIQHLPYFKIQYSYSDSKSITLEQREREDGRKKLEIRFSPPMYTPAINGTMPLIKRLQQVSGKRDLFESSVYRRALEELDKHISKLFEDERQPVFIPAGRNMAVTYADFFKQNFYGTLRTDLALIQDENILKQPQFVQDTYLMIQFLQRVQILQDTLKGMTFEDALTRSSLLGSSYLNPSDGQLILDKIEQILKGKYRNNESFGEQIVFSGNDYVYLNNASSGQQEVIRILQDVFLILLSKESAFRVIEEPEAHLFPMAQKYLLEVIAMVLNKTDSQMILTSHSPYILSVVNNLLFASGVAAKLKDSTMSVSIPQFQLKSFETGVYSLADGQCHSIVDPETGLIDQNALDTISEELADEFEKMYDAFVRHGDQSGQ